MSNKAFKIGNELSQRQDGFSERLERLLEIHLDMLPKYGPYWHKHSMNTMRVEAASRFIYYQELYKKIIDVPGVICEFGVQYGSTLSTLTNLRSIYEPFNYSRRIYGFDTFEGMSDPTDADFPADNLFGGFKAEHYMKTQKKDLNINNVHAYAPIEIVKNNFNNNTENRNNLILIKGKVEDTLKIQSNLPDKISILRLDTDWYESTKTELEILYPRLVKNGVLIIDDYGEWSGSRKATNEYFKDKKIAMFKIDRAARLIFKS